MATNAEILGVMRAQRLDIRGPLHRTGFALLAARRRVEAWIPSPEHWLDVVALERAAIAVGEQRERGRRR
jgi:hypothetical protein